MAGKTMGLGRGLGALLDDGFGSDSATTTLPLSQVECFQGQPRKYFDEKALEELVRTAGGTVTGRAAILAEGDALSRKDITFLAPLPVFNPDGSVKS